jgi:putative glutamine amidotransferase
MVLGMKYLDAIGRAGALAMVVRRCPARRSPRCSTASTASASPAAPTCTPTPTAPRRTPSSGRPSRAWTPSSSRLARAADERDMPILAICRGMQVLNVARGGTLHQHIPDVVGDEITHRQPRAPGEPIHGVTVAHGSPASPRSSATATCR